MDLAPSAVHPRPGSRATMLVELLRTEFHQSGRADRPCVELWYFERARRAWDRLANQVRLLRRERLDPRIDEDGHRILAATTGRIADASKPLRFTIPKTADATRGRPANTAPRSRPIRTSSWHRAVRRNPTEQQLSLLRCG